MNYINFKWFVLKHPLLIIGLVSLGVISLVVAVTFSNYSLAFTRDIYITSIGGLAGFIYFLQKAYLDETRLFKELFTEFNTRYDRLNEDLNRIMRETGGTANLVLSSSDVDTLYNYFNLCAEEFLFFRGGYIDPSVWKAWVNGMASFFEDSRIAELWEGEKKTVQGGSYYGFDFDHIKRSGKAALATKAKMQ